MVSGMGQGYASFPLAGLDAEKGYSIYPGFVLLDADMPRTNRLEVYRRIRNMSKIPVLIVTMNDQKSDWQKGVTPRADDYITNPVVFYELLDNVRPPLRGAGYATQDDGPGTFNNSKLEVKWRSHQVLVRGQWVKLSPIEFKILACLIENRGWVVTHEQLMKKAWGTDHNGHKSYVKLYVRYLRQKIEEDPCNPKLILTERGVGYCFPLQSKQSLRRGVDQRTRRGFLPNYDNPVKPRNLAKSVTVK